MALLFLYPGSAGCPGRFIPGKDPVPIVQVVVWTPVPVWTGAENLASIPGFEPRTVQLVANRYTDLAIPTHDLGKYV